MANINRDYLIVLDAKSSVISDADELKYYITDEHSQNLFVNLVVRDIERINKYVEVHDPEKYELELHIVKPNNDIVRPHLQANLLSAQDAIYAFELPKEATDYIGTYKCELRVTYQETDETTITTSNKFKYKVKRSIYNDLDSIQDAPQYPVVIQLFDKLSDINQYEEDRRANELARQVAEQQRQTRFDALDAVMVDGIQGMDDKVVEVENRITTKEQAVDKLIVDTKADINNYKVAKDQEIDDYKTAKDTEINTAIANQNKQITDAVNAQDSKIDTAIKAQNDKISVVENNDIVQNNRLDVLENRATTHESQLTTIETKNVEQDSRLDIAENRLANIGNDITNTMQPIIDGHTARLDAIEAIDVAQNNRLDAIEAKNQQQDDRLLNIEKVNKKQDIDINCLFNLHSVDIEEEGNSVYLQNSTDGRVIIDNIQGNTMVNCNKEPDKELILNGNINTNGYSNVTLTEGVDGGLVDVALEGNTMVNVCDQKDPVAITKSYTVETGNHVALQGEYDGKCRPVVTGNTLWIDNDTEDVLTAFDDTKNLRLQSSFEDKVVTQEMVDSGEEVADNLGKYKVEYKVTGKNLISSEFIEGWLNVSTGDIVSASDKIGTLNLVKVTPNTTYTITKADGGRVIVAEYGSNKKMISYAGVSATFTISNSTHYIRIFIDATTTITGHQLEEGDRGTAYEPYKEYTKTLYLNSPLLEGDTIEQQGDNVVHVHRYGKVKLNDLFPGTGQVFDNGVLHFGNNNYLHIQNTNNTICDKMIIALLTPSVSSTSNAICTAMNSNQWRIYVPGLTTLDEYIDWIANSDINIVYEKATPQYEVISRNDTILCDSYVNGHLDVDSAVPVDKVDFLHFEKDLTYLYANTQYAVQFTSDSAITVDITLGGTKLLAQSIVAGLNKITITTSETLVDNKLIIEGVGTNIKEVVVTNTDRDFGYFEGMKSVGECENNTLEIICKNNDNSKSNTQTLTHEPLRAVGDIKDKYVLIDGKWYIERNCGVRAYQEGDIDNYITDKINTAYPLSAPTYEPIDYNPFTVYSDTTHISNNSTIPCNMTIKNTGYNCLLKPSTTYTVSSNLGLNTVTTPSVLSEDCLRFYDTDTSTVTKMKNVTILEGDYTTGKPIPSHFSGIESCFEQEYDEVVGKYKVKIRVQNEDASKENYIEFYINEPLRGIGDVKDKVYVKDDKVVVERKCKQENMSELIFAGDTSDTMKCLILFKSKPKAISNIFSNSRGYESATKGQMYVQERGDGMTYLWIPTDPMSRDEFTSFLNEKNATIVYQLAEPIYEEVEYNDVKLFIESFKNSTLFYNSNIPVTSKLYYSYSVPIVDTVAQTANVTDEQDVMIIDLATQVAVMEMLLM